MGKIVIGTRKSQLALNQTKQVIQKVKDPNEEQSFLIREMTTKGDQNLNISLDKFKGRGVFNQEIDQALLDHEIDCAVHSMKDLPVRLPSSLSIAAVPKREDPRDALITRNNLSLKNLPKGAVVGTSSSRRAAQLQAIRSDLRPKKLRGPIDSRINQLHQGDYDAIILAVAGLKRLKLEHHITEYLHLDSFLPAACQGALIIQCRSEDLHIKNIFKAIHDEETALATETERIFIHRMDAQEQVPIGCLATIHHEKITLRGVILRKDGKEAIQGKAKGKSPKQVAKKLSEKLLNKGAQRIIERYTRS